MPPSDPPLLERLAEEKQRRLDELLERNSEGTLSPGERQSLEALVAEAEEIMIANAQKLAEFARSQAPAAPPTAVPVTIWVAPQHAEG